MSGQTQQVEGAATAATQAPVKGSLIQTQIGRVTSDKMDKTVRSWSSTRSSTSSTAR